MCDYMYTGASITCALKPVLGENRLFWGDFWLANVCGAII